MCHSGFGQLDPEALVNQRSRFSAAAALIIFMSYIVSGRPRSSGRREMVSAGNNRERLLFGVPQADDALVDLTSHRECTPEAHVLPVLSRLPPR